MLRSHRPRRLPKFQHRASLGLAAGSLPPIARAQSLMAHQCTDTRLGYEAIGDMLTIMVLYYDSKHVSYAIIV